MKKVLITGTSTGIGLTAAIHLARNGYDVYAGLRNPANASELQAAIGSGLPIHAVQLDVDSDESVSTAVQKVLAEAGAIDILVNNAGIGNGGPIELTPIDIAKRVFETNYFGAIRMILATVPHMRERGSGVVVNVTSILGQIVAGASGHYSATKFALEAASESLALEARPYGIRVAIVEPGVIATPIFSKHPPPADMSGMPYATSIRRVIGLFTAQLSNPTLPEAVAEVIQHAIETDAPKLRYLVGRDAELLLRLRRGTSDENWTASGLLSDEEYFASVEAATGVNLFAKSANA